MTARVIREWFLRHPVSRVASHCRMAALTEARQRMLMSPREARVARDGILFSDGSELGLGKGYPVTGEVTSDGQLKVMFEGNLIVIYSPIDERL